MIVMNFAGGRAVKFGSTVSQWIWESVSEAVKVEIWICPRDL